MKNKNNFSYKLIVIFFVLLVILIIGSVVSMKVLLRDVQSSAGYTSNYYSHHYAFIRPDGDKDFWNNVYMGAKEKGEELGVYVEDFGSALTVDYSTNDLLKIAINADVDGIIIDGDSSEETTRLINEANQNNIPVVTIMDDSSESDRICFVGISSYAIGRQYGEKLIGLVDKNSEKTLSVTVMMESEHDNSGQDLVIAGITDVFAEAGLDSKLNIEGIYIDNSMAFGAEEEIRDIFLNGELPNVMIALSSVYTRCLFQAAVDYNKVGDCRIFGFHDSDDILDAVSKNIIDATISVNTYDMGSASVEALEEYLNTGYVSAYLAQDTKMISVDEAKAQLYAENKESN